MIIDQCQIGRIVMLVSTCRWLDNVIDVKISGLDVLHKIII